jgi:hypothetical protein
MRYLKTILVFTGLGIVAAGVTSGIGGAASTTCKVNLAKFNNMKPGMSIWQIERDVGCSGRELSRSRYSRSSTVVVAWDGPGFLGANLKATFHNDKLVAKAQFGLR